MVRFSNLVLLAAVVTPSAAFQPLSATTTTSPYQVLSSSASSSSLKAIALDPTESINDQASSVEQSSSKTPKQGMLPDLDGIAMSGLKGQALSMTNFPQAKDLKAVIPKDCFEPETAKSLSYLAVSVTGTALCTAVGLNLLNVFDPSNVLTWPLWTAYSAVTGTVAMGLWVLAHECGHGAFSKNRQLQDAVGYTLHSLMLVPYYSWQRSHAVHHQYTNHMELGETHVPEKVEGDGESSSLGLRQFCMEKFGDKTGLRVFGAFQSFMHLIIGWPAYLLIGATGGPARGMTNHYYPDPLTTPEMPKKELFPGNWKEKVWKSDIGIAAVVAMALTASVLVGPATVMALYGGPLIIVNAWLVLYTWLQHTDTDVPHFSSDEHGFVKGALHTIDRPYNKLDPFGAIDFLHHQIGTTHVAHHFDSTIPHYKAQTATDAIKENFPEFYLYDPTPIPQALWRIAKGCTAVEKRGDFWIWNNKGKEELVEYKGDNA